MNVKIEAKKYHITPVIFILNLGFEPTFQKLISVFHLITLRNYVKLLNINVKLFLSSLQEMQLQLIFHYITTHKLFS